MRTFTFTWIVGVLLVGWSSNAQAQETDTTAIETVQDTLSVGEENDYEEEEVYQDSDEEMEENDTYMDSTTIQWGNRSRIIITEDGDGNRVIKLVKKKDGDVIIEEDAGVEYERDDWDDDDRRRRRKNYNTVDFLAFDLGVTNYYNDNNFGVDAINNPDLEVRAFRPGAHVALHFLPTTVSLFGRGAVNIKTALTIDWTQYYFTEDIQLLPDMDTLTWNVTGIDYDRNKLTTRYAQIPLLLNFDTNPGSDDGFSFSVGGYAGFLWGAKTKQVSDAEGKEKVRDEFNVNRFRYGLTARVDLAWLDIYFNLNMSQVFEENEDRGINAQSFTVGINIIDF